ncbi:imidazolonepropionase [Paenibacillus thiaminolyticus]|uniref:Imidazolonepropionase n=1 Tax=Paenibacillus thiaminolyticus TaxID=49283 RepID=A0AAP9J009_PANTH|nr:imidazolonepropionase [Paenibacillus thiaminolyticus]MCY9536057.1 imidazolonepropionase [Paenibacillus thiaminolyticus]MCY9602282.1 imidazolonepropionase [Paenibacillus thiaminolyticus]MCY9608677.1 imidazolonepropionase [Paenibacillus thiaminolyticus]MCY9613423.1 imidazolonepropionase [Paenibacillus thiaminolyticus]MCY9620242.1 imidazolonepropionase [Paenibacillus thiaminolyticus]
MEHNRIDLLIHNIGTLITMQGRRGPRTGREMSEVGAVRKGAVAIRDGLIVAAGPEDEVMADISGLAIERKHDAQGLLVTPGLIDPHTHLVHGGSREHELALKLKGMSYLEILAQGGGILSTVRATRQATEEELYAKAKASLDIMLSFGVTTAEAKSGYGLTLEDELKQLRVTHRLNREHPVDLVSTFMGAHVVPEEYKGRSGEFVRLVIEQMLPEVKRQGLAEFCDVFCEHGVFSVDESEQILLAAKELGFGLKIHADEIEPIGGAQLAGKLGCISAEHLIAASDEGLEAMRQAGVVAVCLPATSFNLRLTHHARARTMIEMGLAVALSTDYNPGSSPTEALQLVMTLGCLNLGMTPEEVLTAVTINAAHAIGRADTVGSLEAGKQADLVIFKAANLAYLPYHFGINHVHTVFKRGNVVVSTGN